MSSHRGSRVAVAASGLGHVSRGIEAWAADLATELHKRSVDVILCKGAGEVERPFEVVLPCLRRESRANQQLQRAIPVALRWRLGLGNGYEIEQASFVLRLLATLRRKSVDILHVQDPQVAVLVQRARALGLVCTKTILAHGTEEPAQFLSKVEYLQHLAPWHLEDVKKAGAWKPTWTAIPNFIDTDKFAPGRADSLRAELGIPSDGIVVLTAAAIKRHHKRIDYLIKEFAQLIARHPELPVWLVVAGGREHETDALVAEGRALLGDRVRFLVKYPRERMPELYRAADIFVLCSLFEMMPIALLEATASGLPCVVHRHPILEWMTGSGGAVSDLDTPGGLVTELDALTASSYSRAAKGEAARQHCLAHFSADVVVKQILAYYHVVLGERGARERDAFSGFA